MRSGCIAAVALLFLTVALTPVALGQDAVPAITPCKDHVCAIIVEWGASGIPEHADRRYGALSAFPGGVLQHLQAAGFRVAPDATAATLIARIRPRLVKAGCDIVPGTGSTDSCITIGEVRVEFEGEGALPKEFRISGRCGEGEFMIVSRFSRYVAEMFDFHLSPSQQKKQRPSSRC